MICIFNACTAVIINESMEVIELAGSGNGIVATLLVNRFAHRKFCVENMMKSSWWMLIFKNTC